MSNTRDTGFLRNAIQVTNQGITFVSGSTTLMSISSSGAVTTTGVISGSNALSASFSLNSALLNGTGSVGFATTGALLEVSSSQQQISSSLLQVSASYTSLSGSYTTFSGSASTRITANSSSIQQVSSSQQQISASLLNVIANYATTGSNSFRANQSITGSLVVSSTITAQTLVVQTVTSSIVYSSGSNIFGSALGDRQTFTGSIQASGSSSHFFMGASVGIGVTNPGVSLEVNGYGKFTGIGINSTPSSIGTNPNYVRLTNTGGDFYLGQEGSTSGTFFNGSLAYDSVLYSGRPYNFIINGVSRMYINSSGDVGIGKTNPSAKLEIESARNSTLLRLTAISGENWDFKNTNTTGVTDVLSIGAAGATVNLSLKDDGSVGIGNTSPSYTLDVSGTGRFNSSLYVNSPIYFQNGGTSYFQMYAGAGGDLVIYNTTTNGFSVYTNSAQRFFVSGSGNIGIATGTPSAKLDVYAGADATSNLVLWGQIIRNEGNGAATGYGTGLKLKISSDGEPYKWAGIAAVAGTGYSNRTDLGLFTAATSTADATEKMRITGDGYVGIGTTTIPAFAANSSILKIGSQAIFGYFGSGANGETWITNNAYYDGSWKGINTASAQIIKLNDNNDIRIFNDASVTASTAFTPTERMRITSGGAIFNKAALGGYTSFIGVIGPGNVGNRYLHARINTIGSMMVWIKIFGYSYVNAILEGIGGGYVDGGTGQLGQNFNNGSIPIIHQNGSYIEVVVDTIGTGTGNRWGNITFLGGTDNLTTIQPLEIMTYSWTSTTTRVY